VNFSASTPLVGQKKLPAISFDPLPASVSLVDRVACGPPVVKSPLRVLIASYSQDEDRERSHRHAGQDEFLEHLTSFLP
jgi:hypothetical protein